MKTENRNVEAKIPRVMIVGTGSGCGKTTLTCAILQTLVNDNKPVASFKCGPDYIDPMFHSKVIGAKSRNLDLFMCDKEVVKYLFANNSKDTQISVIEGVMGMYDGLSASSDDCSSNDLALVTDTPQILAVNVKGKSFSVVAEILGYKNFRKNNLKGVVLNHCSKGMYPVYKEMIEKNTDLEVLGYLPKMEQAEIGSRHLGLITADEITDLKQRLAEMAEVAKETLDMDRIVELANEHASFSYQDITIEKTTKSPVTIAVARDNAFCFYYEDNLSLLKQLGANIVYFSPLNDEKLPSNIDGILLGGGYPEEYTEQLSDNKTMLCCIKRTVLDGVPTVAECGGFMYLGDTINKVGMVGELAVNSAMTTKLSRFGYITLTANEDNLLCEKGMCIKGHEFHYSDSDNNGRCFTASKKSGKTWECIHSTQTLFAGYPHLHYWGNIEFAKNFIKKCAKYQLGKKI